MTEPVLCNSGCLMPAPGYLAGVKRLAARGRSPSCFRRSDHGIPYRTWVAPKVTSTSSQTWRPSARLLEVASPSVLLPDSADLMEQMFTGGVVFGGTFNGNPVSLAGADACLVELSRDGGAALKWANRMGRRLMVGIEDLARSHRIPAKVTGFGAAFYSTSPGGKACRTIVTPSKITRDFCSGFSTWLWLKV